MRLRPQSRNRQQCPTTVRWTKLLPDRRSDPDTPFGRRRSFHPPEAAASLCAGPADKKRRPEMEEIAAGCISERFFSYFCRKDTRGVPFRLRETAEIIPYELDAVNTAERTCS